MAKPAGKKKRFSVNFAGVESGGGRAVPDGQYVAELTDIDQKEGQDSGQPYLACQWKITSKKSEGAKVFDNISLQPQALWRFKTLLEVLGEDVPDGAMELDFSDLIGKEARIEVTNEKYEGKNRPRITGFEPLEGGGSSSDESDEEEETEEETEEEEEKDEETETPKKKKKSTGKLKVGTKVKFKDDDDKTVKGVVTGIDGDTAQIEDSSGEEWEVEVTELTVV